MVRCSSLAKALKVARSSGFLGNPPTPGDGDEGGDVEAGAPLQSAGADTVAGGSMSFEDAERTLEQVKGYKVVPPPPSHSAGTKRKNPEHTAADPTTAAASSSSSSSPHKSSKPCPSNLALPKAVGAAGAVPEAQESPKGALAAAPAAVPPLKPSGSGSGEQRGGEEGELTKETGGEGEGRGAGQGEGGGVEGVEGAELVRLNSEGKFDIAPGLGSLNAGDDDDEEEEEEEEDGDFVPAGDVDSDSSAENLPRTRCVNCTQPLHECNGSICAPGHSLARADVFTTEEEGGGEEGEGDSAGQWSSAGAAARIQAEARQIAARITMAPPYFQPGVRVGGGTVLAYDARMTLHAPPASDCHPERPHRVATIFQHLTAAGVAARCEVVGGTECVMSEATLVHSLEHWHAIAATEHDGRTRIGADTYTNSHSALAARIATGTVLDVARRVLRGDAANAIAVVRPPGHHAERDVVMGFCFFNYVAVAAELARAEFGLSRILIVDWDVHHGNGTQNAFYRDSGVLYLSLHRYDAGGFYPGTGGMGEVGAGAGEGFNVNIPWPHGGVGDREYLAAFEQVVMPIARSFNPELVLVSAGFDAARGDPLGGCDVTPYGYAMMTNMLRGLAGGRVVVALEGGYNLRSISLSMEAVARTLLGDAPPPQPPAGRAREWGGPCGMSGAVVRMLYAVRELHADHWPALDPRPPPPPPQLWQPLSTDTNRDTALSDDNDGGGGGEEEAGGEEEEEEEEEGAGDGPEGRVGEGAVRREGGAGRSAPSLREWLATYGRHWGRSGVWRWHVQRRALMNQFYPNASPLPSTPRPGPAAAATGSAPAQPQQDAGPTAPRAHPTV